MKKSLRPGGIICSQAGSIWIKEDLDTMVRLSKDCSSNFKKVTLAIMSIPSYPTGNISFIMATDNEVRKIFIEFMMYQNFVGIFNDSTDYYLFIV